MNLNFRLTNVYIQYTHTHTRRQRENEIVRDTCWPRRATKVCLVNMLHIKSNKPGSSTHVIMGIGTKNGSENSTEWRLMHKQLQTKFGAVKSGSDLFIDMNLAKACDITYISPDAWRKYLLLKRFNYHFKRRYMDWNNKKIVVLMEYSTWVQSLLDYYPQ